MTDRKTYSAEQLSNIIKAHHEWLVAGLPLGDARRADLTDADLTDAVLRRAVLTGAVLRRAVLTGADLTGAVLTDADLTDAVLTGAVLTDADLTGADLTGADLTGAVLTDADLTDAVLRRAVLTGAVLTPIREAFRRVLDAAPGEVPALRAALVEGRVNGSTYSGPCSCLVGTIATARGVSTDDLDGILAPDSTSTHERWFMGISQGDTPANNQVSAITVGWVDEWLTERAAVAMVSAEPVTP